MNRCTRCARADLAGRTHPDGTPACFVDEDLCSLCQESGETATAAAHQAVEAASELLRYAREGEQLSGAPFHPDVEPIEKLADALKLALEVEAPWIDANTDTLDAEMLELRAQLFGALVRYLEHEAEPMLRGRYGEATGRRLFAAAADLTRLAGWTSYDIGAHGLAQRYFVQALRLSQAAGDRAARRP